MQLPFWAWTGAVCGLFGALGAALGYAAEKAGWKAGRYLAIAGIVAGLTLSRSDQFRNFVQRANWTESATEAEIMKAAPEVYGYLKVAYPQDYASLLSQLTDLAVTATSSVGVQEQAALLMQNLRHKYASFISLAGEVELSALMAEQIKFYNSLLRDDPTECAKVAINGPISIAGTEAASKYLDAFSSQTLVLFKAIRAGMDRPVARREATNDDWAAVGNAMAAAGSPDRYFDAISTLSVSNPDTCPALIDMMQAINGSDTDEVRIVRASYLASLAAN